MEDYLGPVGTKSELFLKLTKRIDKPREGYTMHFMEDRNGRKAMFYNYVGEEFGEGECVLLKATIAEHRKSKFDDGKPLTYINRVTIVKNMGSKSEKKETKKWQEQLTEENEIETEESVLLRNDLKYIRT